VPPQRRARPAVFPVALPPAVLFSLFLRRSRHPHPHSLPLPGPPMKLHVPQPPFTLGEARIFTRFFPPPIFILTEVWPPSAALFPHPSPVFFFHSPRGYHVTTPPSAVKIQIFISALDGRGRCFLVGAPHHPTLPFTRRVRDVFFASVGPAPSHTRLTLHDSDSSLPIHGPLPAAAEPLRR